MPPLPDRQPILRGATLYLRPLTENDWNDLYALASDPLIWADHPASDRWREPVFRRFFDDALSSGGALAICDTATGSIIGSSRFDTTRAGPNEMEIGWTFLSRARWGGGANAAVKRLMVEHALRFVERVIFVVGEDNGRSRTALARVGAVSTGRELISDMAGKPVRHLIYAIDRRMFAAGPLSRSPS